MHKQISIVTYGKRPIPFLVSVCQSYHEEHSIDAKRALKGLKDHVDEVLAVQWMAMRWKGKYGRAVGQDAAGSDEIYIRATGIVREIGQVVRFLDDIVSVAETEPRDIKAKFFGGEFTFQAAEVCFPVIDAMGLSVT